MGISGKPELGLSAAGQDDPVRLRGGEDFDNIMTDQSVIFKRS